MSARSFVKEEQWADNWQKLQLLARQFERTILTFTKYY
jgi:hypothetical protein